MLALNAGPKYTRREPYKPHKVSPAIPMNPINKVHPAIPINPVNYKPHVCPAAGGSVVDTASDVTAQAGFLKGFGFSCPFWKLLCMTIFCFCINFIAEGCIMFTLGGCLWSRGCRALHLSSSLSNSLERHSFGLSCDS